MTAAIAALALAPLLFAAGQPGKEILHPVALVIFGGLIVGTVLDSFLTPLLFLSFGERALERWLGEAGAATPATAADAQVARPDASAAGLS